MAQLHHKLRIFSSKVFHFWKLNMPFPSESIWGKVTLSINELRKSFIFNGLALTFLLLSIPLVYAYRTTAYYSPWYFYVSFILWATTLIYFFQQRKKAHQLYDSFLSEIEQRLAQGKNVQIETQKNKLLQQLSLLIHFKYLRLSILSIALVSLSTYFYNTMRIGFVQKPETLQTVVYDKVRKNELSAQRVEHKLWKSQKTLTQTERLMKMHQKRLQEIQQSIYTHYATVREANGYRSKNAQIALQMKDKTPQQIEEMFRQDEFMMTQFKGLVEMKLDLEDKPIEQSAAILGTDGSLIKEFHDLNYRYDQAVALGYHSIGKDYQAMQTTQKLIEKDKNTLEKIKKAMQQDSVVWKNLKNEWKNAKKLLRKINEAKELEEQKTKLKRKS